jgi:hypothetical protein
MAVAGCPPVRRGSHWISQRVTQRNQVMTWDFVKIGEASHWLLVSADFIWKMGDGSLTRASRVQESPALRSRDKHHFQVGRYPAASMECSSFTIFRDGNSTEVPSATKPRPSLALALLTEPKMPCVQPFRSYPIARWPVGRGTGAGLAHAQPTPAAGGACSHNRQHQLRVLGSKSIGREPLIFELR